MQPMGRIRLQTLMDFMTRGFMVRVFCRNCGHSRELDPAGLSLLCIRRGWSTRVYQTQRFFRCSKCLTKNCEIQPGRMTE